MTSTIALPRFPFQRLIVSDRFMWTLHTANPEHWVPISTVASFKRMREFSSLGEAGLAEALKSSVALEVDETNSKVRRRTEVTEPKGQFERSVYAVSYPLSCLTFSSRSDRPYRHRKALVRRYRGSRRSSKTSLTNMDARTPCACAARRTPSSSRCQARFAPSLYVN